MTASRIAFVATLFVAPLVTARSADAQAEPSTQATEPEEYREAIDQAVKEFQLRNFEEARALFSRAHSFAPNARTLRGLGMVEFELRNYGASVRHLEQSLASDVKPLAGELRAETEKLLERAAGFIARVAIEVKPGAARVLVDGVPVEIGEGGILRLQIGDHTIEVRAEQFKPEKRRLTVHGGEDQRLVIVLTQEAAPPTDQERRPLWRNPWLWTGVSIAAVGVAVGAAFLLQHDDEERLRPVTTPNTPAGAGLQGLIAW